MIGLPEIHASASDQRDCTNAHRDNQSQHDCILDYCRATFITEELVNAFHIGVGLAGREKLGILHGQPGLGEPRNVPNKL